MPHPPPARQQNATVYLDARHHMNRRLFRSRPSSLLQPFLWSRACSGLGADHDKLVSRREQITGLEALLNGAAPIVAVADFLRETAISKLELYIREEGDDFGVSTTGLATLACTFGAHTALAELSLIGGLGPDSARALADGLRANSSVTSLSLVGTPIGEEGACALSAALATDGLLTTLSLPYCGIGPAGGVALAGALRTNAALRYLDMSGNHLCGKQQLPGGAWDGEHTAVAMAALADALPHSAVTSLNLRHNELDDAGCVAFAAALRADAPLATLNLQLNSFGDAGAIALLESLAANTSARSIDLRENELGKKAMKDAQLGLARRRAEAGLLGRIAVELPEKHPKLWPKDTQIG